MVVHTVDGRGNMLLGLLSDYFGVAGAAMRQEIVKGANEARRLLALRKVEYSALRTCLTPQAEKSEIAIFVDSTKVGSGWYGPPVHERILPALYGSGPHAVLHGDLSYERELGDAIWQTLESEVRCSRAANVPRLAQIYCVYVNNCSEQVSAAIVQAVVNEPWFVGAADVTLSTPLKTYLSTTVRQGYLTFRNSVIQPHPDDIAENVNENTLGYPFTESGFRCLSVPDLYYGLFLSYKIERPVLPGFERDQLYALNAITDSPIDIADCSIEIAEDKFEYLRRAKSGTLRRLGVMEEPSATLEMLIRAKLCSNYLYNLRFRPDCSVSTFNILLELSAVDTGEHVRTVAAFAYEEERRVIRLVTFY